MLKSLEMRPLNEMLDVRPPDLADVRPVPQPQRMRAATNRPLLVSIGVAALLAVAFLLAPAMGTDLSAQVARSSFVARFGFAPIDFSWYGGVSQFGYSLYASWLAGIVGVRTSGAIAAVVSAGALAWLLVRGSARRPLLGGVLGAAVLVGNLVSGRITFAIGLALGLLALCAVLASRPPRWLRLTLAGVLAALATWGSPVAGLFVGVAGGALLLNDLWPAAPGRWGRRLAVPRAESLVLCLAPAAAVAPMALLFSNGGEQPFTAESMRINVALAAIVFAVLPGRRTLRIGAVLTVVLLLGAYHLPSPIGSNAMRLPMLFALPVIAAFASLDRRWLAALLAVLIWWQNPVVTNDLGRMGSAPARADFYQPLLDELTRRAPIGRVEVVPLRDHWESAYVARAVPIARGWERQVDVGRNPLFYRTSLDPDDYHDWLRHNAVSYVAVAPDSPQDRYARTEATLVLAGVPYLREVWRTEQWRLYEVIDAVPFVSAPGRLIESTGGGVRFHADSPGEVLVRVRWSRWLTLEGAGGCLAPAPDGWTRVRVERPGEYVISSGLRSGPHCTGEPA